MIHFLYLPVYVIASHRLKVTCDFFSAVDNTVRSNFDVGIMRWIVLLSVLVPRILGAELAGNPLGSDISVTTDDGAVIHCLVSGPKDSPLSPLLFVPGYLMPGDIFEFQIRHFQKNRRVVAMDPRSGEVLALVSKPNYDPNEFSTGITRARWEELSQGGNYPLFNRAIQAAYPPGSTLKPFVYGLAMERLGRGAQDRSFHMGDD